MNSLTDAGTWQEEEPLPLFSALNEPEDLPGLFALIDAICAGDDENE